MDTGFFLGTPPKPQTPKILRLQVRIDSCPYIQVLQNWRAQLGFRVCLTHSNARFMFYMGRSRYGD